MGLRPSVQAWCVALVLAMRARVGVLVLVYVLWYGVKRCVPALVLPACVANGFVVITWLMWAREVCWCQYWHCVLGARSSHGPGYVMDDGSMFWRWCAGDGVGCV